MNKGTGMGRFLTPAGVRCLLLRKIYRARRHRQRCHSCPRREFVLHRNRSGGRAGLRRRVRHFARVAGQGKLGSGFPCTAISLMMPPNIPAGSTGRRPLRHVSPPVRLAPGAACGRPAMPA
ncbi:hypothetical protein CBM2587_B90612 [Cupriavidus taiwanensis]|uniref:Uncharacterized protein n=1 Tax=Cupriavidus taiwanensis TaxID=164546 RepID=A0A375CDH9_9BURK|nr:hypothetical protein CBM2587_B90612 [Cupriavidus taiwanensis]